MTWGLAEPVAVLGRMAFAFRACIRSQLLPCMGAAGCFSESGMKDMQ